MNSVELIKKICKERKIPISRLERDLGYGNGYIGQLKKGTVPSNRAIEIANYLGITVDYLMTGTTGNDICSPCPDCGMWYDANELEDVKAHQKNHTDWVKATEKYGKLYCNSIENERIKAENRKISHNITLPLDERCNAQLEVLRCLFSRSVEANEYNLRHVPFDEYVAMMLGNESYKRNLEDDLYQALSKKYGIKTGINSGTIYYIPKPQISTLTRRDKRDIAKDLNNIMSKLTSGEAGPAAYDGEELDPEAAELFKEELELALKRLKVINKEKYTNKRYKK